MPYQIAIINDNPIDIEYISVLVKHWSSLRNITIHIETFPSAEAFLFIYSENNVWDILLLDIEMHGKNWQKLRF